MQDYTLKNDNNHAYAGQLNNFTHVGMRSKNH